MKLFGTKEIDSCSGWNLKGEEAQAVGVYLIECKANNTLYVGSTRNSFKHRAWQHISDLRKGKHGNAILQNTYNKYGEGALVFQIWEVCAAEYVLGQEQFWMNMFSPSMNIMKTATSRYGMSHSEATKAKLRNKVLSEETRQKIKLARQAQIFTPEQLEYRATKVRAANNKAIWCSNGQVYESLKAASKDTGVSYSTINHILYNRIKHPNCGLHFSFVKEEE